MPITMYNGGHTTRNTQKGNTMTNNNNPKPTNCACSRMACASFVAGNQCFRCQQVDNRKAGITFTDEMDEWRCWFAGNRKRQEVHEAGPNFRPAGRFNVGVEEEGESVWDW